MRVSVHGELTVFHTKDSQNIGALSQCLQDCFIKLVTIKPLHMILLYDIIDDIMFYTKENKLPGLLLAIDFEKAFDSLDWTFLNKALSAFNFGQSFIKWVNTFYSNIQSCNMNNGFSSVHFDVMRGVRQGDPLSSYLFIIVLETLAIYVRGSDEIKGINLRDEHEVNCFC